MGTTDNEDTGGAVSSAEEDEGRYQSPVTSHQSPFSGHQSLLSSLLDLLFPPLCHVCKRFIPRGRKIHLCPDCSAGFTPIGPPLCTICGTPFLTEGGIDHPCASCLSHPPPYDAARAAFLFHGPARELIHRFKYNRHIQLRRPLGLLLAERLTPDVARWGADLLLPVPLHRRRLTQRGFNQAALLVELLAKEWHIPLSRHNLRRIRWTEPQVNLPAHERPGNVRGAFALARPAEVVGRRIVLVDDVFTTGSTLAECGRVLKRAGATAVYAVTVAKAVGE